MNDPSEPKKMTLAFEIRERKKFSLILALSGLEAVSAGTISIQAVQEKLLKDFPEILTQFPRYESYFSISSMLAFFGGLFFFICPMSIFLWIARYLLAMSIAYVILGSKGIAGSYPIAFNIMYWSCVIIPITARFTTIKFYIKNTKYDLALFIFLSLAFLIWAAFEFFNIQS
jgi:hypothetical protein